MATSPPSKKALAAAWAVSHMSQQEWDNLCERFIENAYGTQGQFPTAAAGGSALVSHPNRPVGNPLDGAEPGDLLFFQPDASNQNAGHVGIYVGNGKMVSATPTGVRTTGILTDPYYGPRFMGWGSAPDAWKGPTSTPDLVKGAQQLVGAGEGGTAGTAGTAGGGNVASATDTAQTAELQRQVEEIDRRIAQAQQQLDLLTGASQGPPGPDVAAQLAGVGAPDPITGIVPSEDETRNKVAAQLRKQLTDLQGARNTTAEALAKAKDTAAKDPKAPSPKSQVQNFGTAANPDWRSFNPDTNQWESMPNQPKGSAPARRTQIVGNNLIDLDTGSVIAQVPAEARNKRTQVVGNRLVDLDTGDIITTLPTEPKPPQTLTANGGVYPLDPDTGLPDVSRGVQLPQAPQPPQLLQTNTTNPNLVFRDQQGNVTTQPNPDYDQVKAQGAQLAQDLNNKYQQGLIDKQARDSQWDDWYRQNVTLPQQVQAQQHAAWQDQFQYGQAQAAEQRRLQEANRQREQAALQAGNAEVSRWNQMAPAARSNAFVQQYAQAAENLGTPNYHPVSAGAITAPAPILPSGQAYQQGAARALAAISPTAAIQVGAPPPNYQQWDLPALLRSMPAYQGPAAS